MFCNWPRSKKRSSSKPSSKTKGAGTSSGYNWPKTAIYKSASWVRTRPISRQSTKSCIPRYFLALRIFPKLAPCLEPICSSRMMSRLRIYFDTNAIKRSKMIMAAWSWRSCSTSTSKDSSWYLRSAKFWHQQNCPKWRKSSKNWNDYWRKTRYNSTSAV